LAILELLEPTLTLRNLTVQSAMAGISDWEFCCRVAKAGAGAVTLGGFNADTESYIAALRMSEGRKEFLVDLEDLPEQIRMQADKIRRSGAAVFVNIRFADHEAAGELVRRILGSVDAVEINAHCRQPEMVRVGAGEGLLRQPATLLSGINEISELLPVIVKVRAISLTARTLESLDSSGAIGLHLDLMKPGVQSADTRLLERVRRKTGMILIGNNSVRSEHQFVEMLRRGADLVSMARALLEGTGPLRRILESPECWDEMKRKPSWNGRTFVISRSRRI